MSIVRHGSHLHPFFIDPLGDREATAAPEAQDQGARHNDHPPRGWLGFSASGRKDKSTSVLATLRLRKQTVPRREAYDVYAAAAAGRSATRSLGLLRSRLRNPEPRYATPHLPWLGATAAPEAQDQGARVPRREAYDVYAAAAAGRSATRSLGFRRSRQR